MKKCLGCGHTFETAEWECGRCRFKPALKNGHLSFAPEQADENSGYDVHIFAEWAKMERYNFWCVARNRLVTWLIKKYLSFAKKYLEIGCGTGAVLAEVHRRLPDIQLYGSEIYSEGLNFAAQRIPGIELLQMDAHRLPYQEEFDAIGIFDVLEHVEDDESVLSQIAGALTKNGGILLTVPQHPFLWTQYDVAAHHIRRYTASDLRKKIERAGFKVVRMTSFVTLLFPLMVLSRLKKSKPGEKFDVMSQFRQKGLLNWVLSLFMMMEFLLIRLGISFPFGGSLLVVARRT